MEQRTNFSTGQWEVVSCPTTNTNLSVPATNRTAFFRVQSVEESP